MNRTAALLALTLMLLTGLILGQLRNLGSPTPAAIPDADPSTVQTAERFYAAINTLLEAGDPSSLRAVLHPSFVDHAAAPEDSATARDLETHLLAQRAAFPDLRLEATSTVLGGDLVASTLDMAGDGQGAVNGIPVIAHPGPPGVDLVRVAGGVVLERWSSAMLPDPPHIDTLASVAVNRALDARALHVERLTFAPSSSRTLSEHDGVVIIVESGSIGIRLSTFGETTHSGTPPVPTSGDLLATGDIRLIPAGSPYSLKTTGSQTASMLQVRIEAGPTGDQTEPVAVGQEIAPGVIRELLAQRAPLLPNSGPHTLSMYRATLGFQTSIADHAVTGSEIVLVVDGSLFVDTGSGAISLPEDPETAPRQSGAVELSSGQAIVSDPGSRVAYRAAGQSSATILLITLAVTGSDG